MSWLSVIRSILYYCSLPITTFFHWLLVPLAPVLYLGQYMVAGLRYPFTLLAKFETIYIYLGIAAVIGLLTGFILHLSSTLLVSLFNLKPIPDEKGRTAASVRAARTRDKLEQVKQNSTFREKNENSISVKQYSEWLEKNTTQRGDDQGLLGQTIIEEDDDSEEGF